MFINPTSNLSNPSAAILSGTAALGQMRAQLAISKTTPVAPVRPSAQLAPKPGKLPEEDQKFLKDYSAQMTGLREAADALGKAPAAEKSDAAARLVDRYNDAIQFLNKHEDRGIGVLRQVKRMVQPPASEKALGLVGVTVNKDATLSFDPDALARVTQRDGGALAGSILDSLARGAAADARMGARETSQSLLGSTAVQQQSSGPTAAASYDRDALRLMNSYSRQGILQNMNFLAAGAFLNISV